MTDHITTLELPPTTVHAVQIGRIKGPRPSALVGKRHRASGFGLDANELFVEAFLRAMADAEIRQPEQFNNQKLHRQVVYSTWVSSIVGKLRQAPTIRQTVDGSPHLDLRYVLPTHRQGMYEFSFAKYVTPLEHRLIPQFGPETYGLDHLTNQQPRVMADDASWTTPRWRYAIMADLLWYQLGPHLRTMEMADPNNVWRLLMKYFWDLQMVNRRWDHLRPSKRRREVSAYILAIYERTIALLDERWHNRPRFQALISCRTCESRVTDDPILFVPVCSGETLTLAEARLIRVHAWDDLLMATLANCYASLLCQPLQPRSCT